MVTEQTLGNADNSKHGILFGHISSNHYFVTWNIVAVYIDDKTAVDDRRHCTSLNSSGDDDVVVNMALATSLADLFRQCEQVANIFLVFTPILAYNKNTGKPDPLYRTF